MTSRWSGMIDLHECDETCVCPIHGTPMFYWLAGDEHACQDVTCEYGHGDSEARMAWLQVTTANFATMLAGLPRRFFKVTVERVDPIPPEPIPESAIKPGRSRRTDYPVGAPDA